MLRHIQLALLLLPCSGLAQNEPLAFGRIAKNEDPSGNIKLFEAAEIKKRKIDTVFVIVHPSSWLDAASPVRPMPECSFNDTTDRYVFDNEGRLREHTTFSRVDRGETIHFFDTAGNGVRIIFRRQKRDGSISESIIDRRPDSTYGKEKVNTWKAGDDSIVQKIFLMKFRNGMDTAIVRTARYNSIGRLVEEESRVNRRNSVEFGDDTNENTFHYSYAYDDSGRLSYFRDHSSGEYEQIEYPGNNRIKRTFDLISGRLKNEHVRRMIRKDTRIIIDEHEGDRYVVLTLLEKGSRLIRLRSNVTVDDWSYILYEEIIYRSGGKTIFPAAKTSLLNQ